MMAVTTYRGNEGDQLPLTRTYIHTVFGLCTVTETDSCSTP